VSKQIRESWRDDVGWMVFGILPCPSRTRPISKQKLTFRTTELVRGTSLNPINYVDTIRCREQPKHLVWTYYSGGKEYPGA
jgi:hypothetical protein